MICSSWRGALLAGTALLAVPAVAQLPEGGMVVGGSAVITSGGGTTVITQGTDRAAIDWRAFNVGRDQRVEFRQPSSSSWALNRVTGPGASTIAGRVAANGGVVLVNPSGILFTPTAQVDTAGLIATTANIANGDFMAGRMRFDQASARPDARVENHGTITVREAGLAALVAPRVVNAGAIRAPLGRVVLAGAETFAVDLHGDGLLSLEVTGALRTRPMGEDGAPVTELVTNTGTVIAEGGSVVLTAAALDGIVQDLVTAGGTLSAPSSGGRTGTVAIAGRGGSVRVEGALAAAGAAPGTTGGRVEVLADRRVTLAAGSRVDVSGPAGGGSVGIGTTRQGAQPTARTVSIERGATVVADATVAGRGGTVIVNSTQFTAHAGTISATAGPLSGDGGFVELSGQQGLRLGGQVDVSAPRGTLGTILIDPLDLTIAAGGTNGGSLGTGDPNLPFDVPDTTTSLIIDPADIVALVGNIRLQATRNITVATSLDVSNQARSFTLEAGGNIVVNAGVTVTVNGNLTFLAGTAGIPGSSPTAAMQIDGTLASSGTVTLSSATTLNITGAISGANLAIAAAGDVFASGTLTASAGLVVSGNAIAMGGAILSAAAVAVSATTAADLSNPANAIGAINSAAAGSFSLVTSGVLTVAGPITGTDIALRANGDALALNGVVTAANNLALAASGAITQTQILSAASLNVSAASVDLPLANSIGSLGASSATSRLFVGVAAGTTLGVNGIVAVGAGGLLALQADALAFVGAGELRAPAGRLALAPRTAGTAVTVGAAVPGTLSLPTVTLANAGAAVVELGSIAGFLGATAGDIRLAAPLDLGSAGLTLGATGAVTQDAGAAIAAGALSGSAGTLTFDQPGNRFASLGPFAAGGGGLTLINATSLNVAGAVTSAGPVRIEVGPVLSLSATIAAPGQSVRLTSGTNLFQSQTAPVTAAELTVESGFINMPAPNAVQRLAGLVNNDGGNLTTAGALDITGPVDASQLTLTIGGALTQSGAGVVRVPFGLGGTAASVNLTSAANEISILSGFSVSAGSALFTSSVPMLVSGTIQVPFTPGFVLALQADTITFGTGGQAIGDVVRYAPLTGGRAIGVGTDTGGLVITQAMLAQTNAAFVQIGVPPDSTSTLSPITLGALNLGTNIGTLILDGASIGQTGALTAQAIEAIARAGDVILTLSNSVPVVGVLSATQSVSYRSAVGITVGFVDAGIDATLDVTGAMSLVNAIVVPGTLSLVASGGISQSGSFAQITAGTLVAGGPTVSLTADNVIDVLGTVVSAGAVTLRNTRDLVVAGPVGAGSLTLQNTGDLTFTGSITLGGALALDATGSVTQPSGRITASALTGTAGSLSLDQPANEIASVGPFTATSGGFALTTSVPLGVGGAVTMGTGGDLLITADALEIGALGSLNAPGLIAINPLSTTVGIALGAELPGALSLTQAELNRIGPTGTLLLGPRPSSLPTASFVVIAGTGANLTGVASLLDLRTTGAITQSAPLAVNTLSAAAGTNLLLGNPGNSIPVIQALSASGNATLVTAGSLAMNLANAGAALVVNTGGDLTLIDASGGTSVVTSAAGAATLTRVTSGGTASHTAAGLLTLNEVSAALSLAATSTGGGVLLQASVSAPAVSLTAAGAVSQTEGAIITAASLSGTAGSLTLTEDNVVGTLSYSAGQVTFTNTAPLTVAALSANAVTLDVAGALTLAGIIGGNGVVTLDATGAITQTGGFLSAGLLLGSAASANLPLANAVGVLGTFDAPGGLLLTNRGTLITSGTLTAGGVTLRVLDGDILLGGVIATGGALRLDATGTITDAAGAATTAASLGGSAGDLVLDSAVGIPMLADFSAAGGIRLVTAGALTVAGPVSGNDIVLLVPGGLTFTGNVTARQALFTQATGPVQQVAGVIETPSFSGTGGATFLTAQNRIDAIDGYTANSPFVLTVAGDLVIRQPLRAEDVVLTVGGALTQGERGIIVATTLSGSAAQATLDAANQIIRLAGFATTGDFVLVNARGLDLAGILGAANVDLRIGGDLTQSAGIIRTSVLTGASAGNTDLTGGNCVGTLGPWSTGDRLTFVNGQPLVVQGAITSRVTDISAVGTITLRGDMTGDQITFTSSAGACEACTGIPGDICPAGFEQEDVSTINPLGSGPFVLTVDTAAGNGDITLGGLDALSHQVILSPGDGRISGLINAGRLLIVIGAGTADLFGTVGGASGAVAAAAADSDPIPDIRFRLNSCPIGSVNCTQLPVMQQPQPNPLTNLRVEVGRDRDRDSDVVLPGVAAQDF